MGVLDDLGSFTLEGKLDKIKRKMTPLTGSTNNRCGWSGLGLYTKRSLVDLSLHDHHRRFFRIERRPVNGRPELTLCYYLDE